MIPFETLEPAWADLVRWSPNRGPRPRWAHSVGCVVLHATAYVHDELEAERWMCNPAAQVSAHLHIRRNGTVVRLVRDHERAWHAGQARWREVTDVNSVSLGWEIANRNNGRDPYTDAQYATVAGLAAHYIRQGLGFESLVSHRSVALPPGRKSDPLGWDWGRLEHETRQLLVGGPAPRLTEPHALRPPPHWVAANATPD